MIAVDNGSQDETALVLGRHSDWIRVLPLSENLGIEGLNLGFQRALGDVILVLDDDSHPLNKATLDHLIEDFDRDSRTGVVACRIESKKGCAVNTWHLPEYPDDDRVVESPVFVGCGFAIRRDLFEKIGWFPGAFFLYQNEIDVAIQVVKSGYRIVYDPRCRVVHRCSSTGRAHWRQVFYPTRNTLWLMRRHTKGMQSVYSILSRICFGLVRALQSGEYRCFFLAVYQGLTRPIDKDPLSFSVRRRFMVLWLQNSLFHQMIHAMRSLLRTG